MGKKITKIITDAEDLAISILPELSGILTPELATQPDVVVAKVGLAIVANKLRKFCQELSEKMKRKEIRDDLSPMNDSLLDILNMINENADDKKVEAVKRLFFRSVEPNTSDAEQQLIFELIQICKKLSTNELVVLKATSDIFERKNLPVNFMSDSDMNSRHRSVWCRAVAKKIGHDLVSLVEASEKHLEELKLISPTESRSESTYFPAGNFRLTDLGYRLCKYLSSGSK